MELPYQVVRVALDLDGLRAAVAASVGPGEKMRFARFAEIDADAAERLMLAWAMDIEPIASQCLGAPAAMVMMIGTLRHHTTRRAEHAPWHIDAPFFGPFGGRGVTAWLTFDDAGETAPGVEFDLSDRYDAPRVPAGSALVFGSTLRHRTQPIAGDRISVEFRCVPFGDGRGTGALEVPVVLREAGKLVIRWRGEVVFSKPIEQKMAPASSREGA